MPNIVGVVFFLIQQKLTNQMTVIHYTIFDLYYVIVLIKL